MQAEVAAEELGTIGKEAKEEQLFHIAFGERRKLNLDKLKQHMSARGVSQRERVRIYTLLQGLYKEKIEYTKQFIKDFIRYF